MKRFQPSNHSLKQRACLGLIGCMAVLGMSVESFAQTVTTVQRGSKDFHVVNKGDTLYDLSGTYLGDYANWPTLWSYNPQITNPHWIYPGDIVYLKKKGQKAVGPRRVVKQKVVTNELHLAVGGFIEDKELKYVGRIVASPKQANMLAERDTVWVGFGDKKAYTSKEREDTEPKERVKFKDAGEMKRGRLFAIVRPTGKVMKDEKVLGHKYQVLGAVRITELSAKDDNGNYKHYHTATIAQSWKEIHRGDLLIPYEQQLKYVRPVKATKDMVSKIIGSIEPRSNLGEFHYVYLNKGAEQGVRTGNRFFAYQKREGLTFGTKKESDKQIPWRRVGQIMIIDVRKNYSTGVIVDSTKEIFVGDRLEMYKGF